MRLTSAGSVRSAIIPIARPPWPSSASSATLCLAAFLPAIATCLLGVFCGLLFKNPRVTPQQKSLWLIAAGLAMVAAGHLGRKSGQGFYRY